MPAYIPLHQPPLGVASDNDSGDNGELPKPVLEPEPVSTTSSATTTTDDEEQQPPALCSPSPAVSQTETMSSEVSKGLETEEEDDMRRPLLENLAAFTYVFAFVIAPFLSLALTINVMLTPILWFIAIPYFIWFVWDFHTPTRGSRPWLAFRNLHFWEYLAAYFPMKLVKTAELPPDRNYVIGWVD